MILAIDPGNRESGFVLLNSTNLFPVRHGKMENNALVDYLDDYIRQYSVTDLAIEMVESYGMPVGREVFDTVRWIGRFEERYGQQIPYVRLIYRHEEKISICHSAKANDAAIRQALVDRFAPGEPNYGKGTKARPGWFYGFKADVWQAYAVGVTYYELYLKEGG